MKKSATDFNNLINIMDENSLIEDKRIEKKNNRFKRLIGVLAKQYSSLPWNTTISHIRRKVPIIMSLPSTKDIVNKAEL